ncbi:DNA sulfur modification protein DndB [Ramlibacter rhizophilus]|uniref:DNA sulfur modification protein DndB n=2 Tax=Ramlibacter rhizophilus TaxID=1781167 RepID=A0A4Z0BYY6_9BURK|nr:DNA sulfur modification protein DndB [Ramlibacter rhizophilus]
MSENSYFHSFPAVRGVQARREFYIAMCPLRLVPKIFVFDEEEVPPEMRAQRTLNRARVPEIADYLVTHPASYVLSALTASVDGPVNFVGSSGADTPLGMLQVPMGARILINDGQHRRAAIEEAVKHRPELGQENVPVLFFSDEGLQRSQQMFADLNKYAVRPSHSLSTLYDHRDAASELARFLAANCVTFKGLTEMEKSTISNRSTKLFTLSGIKHASRALLGPSSRQTVSTEEKLLAQSYWEAVGESIPDWERARSRQISTAELRQEFVHAHGVTLHALGIAGSALLAAHPKDWRSRVKHLRKVDWSRRNASLWEGRALQNGRLSKANTSVQLTANSIKTVYGLKLSPEDLAFEKS